MPVDRSVIGSSIGVRRVVIERGPVAVFAEAVTDGARIYKDARAAEDPGLLPPPVPPTFPFVMAHWGAFEELQPDGDDRSALVGEILGPLLAKGGLLLHGEQEFEYFSAVRVGDTLFGETTLADVYEKTSPDHTMTFVVTETLWTNEATGAPALVARSNTIVRNRNEAPT